MSSTLVKVQVKYESIVVCTRPQTNTVTSKHSVAK